MAAGDGQQPYNYEKSSPEDLNNWKVQFEGEKTYLEKFLFPSEEEESRLLWLGSQITAIHTALAATQNSNAQTELSLDQNQQLFPDFDYDGQTFEQLVFWLYKLMLELKSPRTSCESLINTPNITLEPGEEKLNELTLRIRFLACNMHKIMEALIARKSFFEQELQNKKLQSGKYAIKKENNFYQLRIDFINELEKIKNVLGTCFEANISQDILTKLKQVNRDLGGKANNIRNQIISLNNEIAQLNKGENQYVLQGQYTQPSLESWVCKESHDILLLILDYDGCFGPYNISCIEGNHTLLEQIVSQIHTRKYTKVIVMVGSARQGMRHDFTLNCKNKNGVATINLEKIVGYLAEKCPGVEVTFDPLLLADLYNNLQSPGYTEHHIRQHYFDLIGESDRNKIWTKVSNIEALQNNQIVSLQEAFHNLYHGEKSKDSDFLGRQYFLLGKEKLLLIYIFTHYIANKNPFSKMDAWLFDDLDKIHNKLKDYFTESPFLLPRNTVLSLFKYANQIDKENSYKEDPTFWYGFYGKDLPQTVLPNFNSPIAQIKGQGLVNRDLFATVRWMADTFSRRLEFRVGSTTYNKSKGVWSNCLQFTSDWAYDYLKQNYPYTKS